MDKLKISFVLPVMNGGKYLRRAVESCFRATNYSHEVIVINDGSKEDEYKKIKDLPVIYIEHSHNKGHAEALNTGIKMVSGEYIAWIGHDDFFYDYTLDCLVDTLDTETMDVAYADFDVLSRNGNKFFSRRPNFTSDEFWEWNLIGQFVVYRKELHKFYGYYNTKYKVAQDWEFFLRLLKNRKIFKRIPVNAGCLWDRNGSLANANYDICTEEIKDMLDNFGKTNWELKGHRVMYGAK